MLTPCQWPGSGAAPVEQSQGSLPALPWWKHRGCSACGDGVRADLVSQLGILMAGEVRVLLPLLSSCKMLLTAFSKLASSVHACLDIILSSAVFAGHCFKTNRKDALKFSPCPVFLCWEERKASRQAAGPAGFAPEYC